MNDKTWTKRLSSLVSWIRETHLGRLTALVTILTVIFFGAGVLIDLLWHDPLGSLPVTANLIAGLLGLPAAILIVNIAAERAVRWGVEKEWELIRLIEIEQVGGDMEVTPG